MINLYTKKLEQLISEMHTEAETISEIEYQQWIEFLKQIHPESELLKENRSILPLPPSDLSPPADFAYPLKEYDDIRQIMLLAESTGYPTWFIQPKLLGLTIVLTYDQGELTSITFQDDTRLEPLEINLVETIPKNILGYTGRIKGVLYMNQEGYAKHYARDSQTAQIAVYQTYESGDADNLQFVATDMDMHNSFLEKMNLLKQLGMTASDYVLFPTNRLSTISSSQLELFFANYISKAAESGLMVDGLIVISDTPLIKEGGEIHASRVTYASKPDST